MTDAPAPATATPTLRLTVELGPAPGDADAGDTDLHVAGTVRPEDGAERAFVGWIGLMALLHDAVVLDRASR